jgi:hypothetical protein
VHNVAIALRAHYRQHRAVEAMDAEEIGLEQPLCFGQAGPPTRSAPALSTMASTDRCSSPRRRPRFEVLGGLLCLILTAIYLG